MKYKVTISTIHEWDEKTLINWAQAVDLSPMTPMSISNADLMRALDRIKESPTLEIANDGDGRTFLKIERAK